MKANDVNTKLYHCSHLHKINGGTYFNLGTKITVHLTRFKIILRFFFVYSIEYV